MSESHGKLRRAITLEPTHRFLAQVAAGCPACSAHLSGCKLGAKLSNDGIPTAPISETNRLACAVPVGGSCSGSTSGRFVGTGSATAPSPSTAAKPEERKYGPCVSMSVPALRARERAGSVQSRASSGVPSGVPSLRRTPACQPSEGLLGHTGRLGSSLAAIAITNVTYSSVAEYICTLHSLHATQVTRDGCEERRRTWCATSAACSGVAEGVWPCCAYMKSCKRSMPSSSHSL
eukprot:scaffold52377_cov72-Phaeocystis_antarctica.AAC.3